MGDKVRILPNGTTTNERIVTFDGDLSEASAGKSVTLTMRDEVDCSRGKLLRVQILHLRWQINLTTLIWMHHEPLMPGRSYYLKIGTQTVSATVTEPKYQINVNTLEQLAAKTLDMNAIGVANVTTDRSILLLHIQKIVTLVASF